MAPSGSSPASMKAGLVPKRSNVPRASLAVSFTVEVDARPSKRRAGGGTMSDFVLLSEGGSMPETAEEQKAVMDAWGAWYAALGAAVKDPGNPISAVKSIAPDGAVSDGGDRSING